MAKKRSAEELMEGFSKAWEAIESASLSGATKQLQAALDARVRLLSVINSISAMREETEDEIEVLKRLISQTASADNGVAVSPASTEAMLTLGTSGMAKLAVWEQAKIALQTHGAYLTAREIADLIRKLGGDPGKRDTAGVTNGAKAHEDVFVRRDDGERVKFGLREWGDSK